MAPDRWLGLEEDRRKAARLAERAATASFEELLRYYWSITPETPRLLAERFIAHALAVAMRGERHRDELGAAPGARLLDLGCGSGGLLVAAARRGDRALGLDVALRWLVVARRRLEDWGAEASLVCGNAEALPFADSSFDALAGLGLLEHVEDPPRSLGEARRVLREGGCALFTVVNRWAPTPEPHVGLWGTGCLPRRLAVAYARRRRGVPYERVRPLGPGLLGRLFREAGFREVAIEADAIPPPEAAGPGRRWAPLVRLYERVRTGSELLRFALSRVAPVLAVRARRLDGASPASSGSPDHPRTGTRRCPPEGG